MAKNGYAKGANRERALARRLMERKGGYAFRTAGSHSPFDVIHLRRGHAPDLHQLKSGGQTAFAGFGPRDREAALLTAHTCGGNPILTWWADREEPLEIPAEDWPAPR